MKHLLLIANISIENKRLIEYAAAFCKHYECKLHVLHISGYSDPVLVSSPYYYNQKNIDFSKQQELESAKKIASKISSIVDNELVQVSVKKGNQEKIINSFINENFIDMIIIGNDDIQKDSDFLDHRNLLLNVIDVPLLVVPDLLLFKPFKKFNFLTSQSEKDIDHIVHLSKVFPDSKIQVSHNPESDTVYGIREQNWKEYVSAKVPERIEFQSFTETVKNYIKHENYSRVKMFDVFVFTAKKRNFWTRLLDPSSTLSFLAGLEIPSVIFKISE